MDNQNDILMRYSVLWIRNYFFRNRIRLFRKFWIRIRFRIQPNLSARRHFFLMLTDFGTARPYFYAINLKISQLIGLIVVYNLSWRAWIVVMLWRLPWVRRAHCAHCRWPIAVSCAFKPSPDVRLRARSLPAGTARHSIVAAAFRQFGAHRI